MFLYEGLEYFEGPSWGLLADFDRIEEHEEAVIQEIRHCGRVMSGIGGENPFVNEVLPPPCLKNVLANEGLGTSYWDTVRCRNAALQGKVWPPNRPPLTNRPPTRQSRGKRFRGGYTLLGPKLRLTF